MKKRCKIFSSAAILSAAIQKDNNNYDLLRLLAAICVIFGHSYAIAPKTGWIDPLQQLIHFNYSGGLAVIVFFFLSGLFVSTSIQKNPNIVRFFVHRVLRIFPALIVAVFLSVFIIGPLFTTLSLKQYFSNSETISYFYHNISLTDLQWKLPGVFSTSKYGVNGSLWTLPLEVRLYLLVAFFGFFQLLKNKWVASLFFILVITLVVVNKGALRYFTQDPDAYYVFGLFIAGAICSFFKERILLGVSGIVILGFFSLFCWNTFLRDAVFYLWVCYALLFIFQTNALKALKLKGDYSYGVYIYGFPIQQSINACFPNHTPFFNFLLSAPCAIVIGIVSWHWIEKPFLLFASSITSSIQSIKLLKFSK